MLTLLTGEGARRHAEIDLDTTFRVESELRLRLDVEALGYEVVPVEPYEKTYPQDDEDGEPTDTVLLAERDGQLAGRIELAKHWNGYGYVQHIVVAPAHRGAGVGSALLRGAQDWARAQGLAGLMLETQQNNVAACRLYARCGFRLQGFDAGLYRGLNPRTREIALFWYWSLA